MAFATHNRTEAQQPGPLTRRMRDTFAHFARALQRLVILPRFRGQTDYPQTGLHARPG